MRFTKMHGLGNDYVVIDGVSRALEIPEQSLPRLAREMSGRHFGIGSDGIILVLPSKAAHFRMRIFNPDGSEAEMCGNGMRIFARYVYDHKLTDRRELEIETLAGIIRPRLQLRAGKVTAVTVDMGVPRLERKEIPMKGKGGRPLRERLRVLGERFEATCVSMGNPHCVIFVEDVDKFPVERLGPAIERHDLFPRRTNVEFVQVVGPAELRMRVWERGAGETLACGTGAAAALVAAHLTGRSGRKAVIHLRGGDLRVSWNPDDHVFITGPAEEVFAGEWPGGD
ncbi:MAG TPA: diaminopimelate epimerase [Armatimonadota bacterium]|nr:diaminopimelate epimerase [Armatimonadota bacterium]